MDALASYFNSFFYQKKLIDLQPIQIEPTWRNNRGGDNAISKRLDRLLLSEEMIQDALVFKSAVETRELSEHRPITLSITSPEEKPLVPFRFNTNWLDHEEYHELEKRNWNPI